MKIPVGKESFDEIRSEGSYYVDKTGLIYVFQKRALVKKLEF